MTELRFNWRPEPLIEKVNTASWETMRHAESDAHDWWDVIAPVGTDPRTSGDLKESWFSNVTVTDTGVWLVFGAGVRYAIYVELGTSTMEPRAPLRTVAGEIAALIPFLLANALANS